MAHAHGPAPARNVLCEQIELLRQSPQAIFKCLVVLFHGLVSAAEAKSFGYVAERWSAGVVLSFPECL